VSRRIILILTIVFVAAVNALVVPRAYRYASNYSLDVLPVGNRLLIPVVYDCDRSLKRLVSIGGADASDFDDIVNRICRYPSPLVVETGDGLMLMPPAAGFNHGVFFFFIFIMICADILFFWGFTVSRIFRLHSSAKFFGNYTFASGVMLSGFVLYLLYQKTALPAAAGSTMLTLMILRAAFLQFGKAMPAKRIKFAYVPLFAVLCAAEYALGSKPLLLISFCLPLVSAILILVSVVRRVWRDRMIPWRNSLLFIFATLVSSVFPLVMIAVSMTRFIPVPVTLFVFLSLLFPFVMANNVLSENLYMFFSVRKRYFIWVAMDISIAIAGSISLYAIWKHSRELDQVLAGSVFAIVIVFALLSVRRFVYRKVQSGRPVYKGFFADASRKISEISASPGNFRAKLERIKTLTEEATGARYFRIELFELSIINQIPDLEGIVLYSRGSAAENHLMKYPSLIYRHSVFTGWIFDFLGIDDPAVELIVPMKSDGFCIGAMYAGQKERNLPFADDEMLFFSSLSSMLSQMVENETLFNEYIVKREYDREIDIASYIQMRLMPKYHPFGKAVSAYLYSRPLLKVTGDYYDFLEIGDDRILVAIGDVAGHGLSAASILATAGNMIHALVEDGKDIGFVMNELNHFFSVRYRGTELMTLVLMMFDRRNRTVEYCNAGHCLPIVFRNGKIVSGVLGERSPILGADRTFSYKISSSETETGDEIILYTDGLIEIQIDRQGNNTGDEILADTVMQAKDMDVEKKIEAFSALVSGFPKSAIHDDITLVGIKVH
jgi:sigma-B regulation protein RsbU (phosphoserine phosphatase)